MAKLAKPVRKSRFGEGPPATHDVRGNLQAPETAPAKAPDEKLDGRSLRATHRTVQFATRVHPDWKRRLHTIAAKTGLLYVEVLEEALEAYEKQLARN